MPTPRPLTSPPLLAPGARVALAAPAGPLTSEHDLPTALDNVRTLGWDPVVMPHARDRSAYFAGADADRVADLHEAWARADVDGIWCLRGGYGVMRLLDALDYDLIARNRKPVIGYSDITALHCAVNARCGIVGHHGPTARAVLTAFSRTSMMRAVAAGENPCGHAPQARTVRGGRAAGRLAGGNLAIVAGLCGTPYAADLDGAIVVLEDVNEPVYRIDRMLQQLLLSGSLRRCAGLVFGAFNRMPDDGVDEGRTLDHVFAEIADATGVPCISDAPFGHIDDMWTLPLGAIAELDADACRLDVLQ